MRGSVGSGVNVVVGVGVVVCCLLFVVCLLCVICSCGGVFIVIVVVVSCSCRCLSPVLRRLLSLASSSWQHSEVEYQRGGPEVEPRVDRSPGGKTQ